MPTPPTIRQATAQNAIADLKKEHPGAELVGFVRERRTSYLATVLVRLEEKKMVTWTHNAEMKAFFHGNYFEPRFSEMPDFETKARKDFADRVMRHA